MWLLGVSKNSPECTNYLRYHQNRNIKGHHGLNKVVVVFILGIGMVCVVIFVQDRNKIESGCAHAVVLCCHCWLGEKPNEMWLYYISVLCCHLRSEEYQHK
jgi:hypothetical protein